MCAGGGWVGWQGRGVPHQGYINYEEIQAWEKTWELLTLHFKVKCKPEWGLHLTGRVPWSELLTPLSLRGTKRDPRRPLRNVASVFPAVWETQ